MSLNDIEAALHAAEVEKLDRRIMELALTRTGCRSGAVFFWDAKAKGLALDFHVVEGLWIELPHVLIRPRRDGRPNGIALHVFQTGAPHVTNDTSNDPHYATYFLEVGSIAAVPIVYQKATLGVLSVSARAKDALDAGQVQELELIARASAKHVRRAQLWKQSREVDPRRPLLIKGLSSEWLEVERRLERVAATDAPILVWGESGTGKELVAQALHFNSRRAAAPLVTVNSAAIPDTLLESTLFGHVRGAFTGASFEKIGEFQKADGGTLFLDEVGELPMMLQAKLLRAVERGEVLPLGSNKAPGRVDVRLVCATHRDLPAMVRAGTFREDLYYRLAIVELRLPPLRAYKDNLEVLAHVFLRQAVERHGRGPRRMSSEAMALLSAYAFPGNVRELRNALEHAVLLAEGEEVRPEDLPRAMHPPGAVVSAEPVAPRRRPLAEMRGVWLAPFERAYVADALTEAGGRVRHAARLAGVDAVTMYRLVKKHGLARPSPSAAVSVRSPSAR